MTIRFFFVLDGDHNTRCVTCHVRNATVDTPTMAVTNIPRTVFAVNILRKASAISIIVWSVTEVEMNMTFAIGMENAPGKKMANFRKLQPTFPKPMNRTSSQRFSVMPLKILVYA